MDADKAGFEQARAALESRITQRLMDFYA